MASMASQGQGFALYPLRIGLAIIFIYMGVDKFQNYSATIGMFELWGFPAASLLVPLVAFAELFGGLGILAGVLPRFSSAVLTVVMLTAAFVLKIPGQFGLFSGGWALEAFLVGGLLTVVVNGAGRPTLFSILGREDLDPEARVLARMRGVGPGDADADGSASGQPVAARPVASR